MLRSIPLFLVLAGAMFGQQTMMFLKLDKIKGDVIANGYEDQIQISGFSYDAEAGAMNSITLTKRFDISSPPLLQAAVLGTDLGEATLTVFTITGESPQVFATVTLEGASVTAVRIENQGTALPTESIALTFKKAEWCYGPGRRNCESFSTRSVPTR